jgi:hypothetical protein
MLLAALFATSAAAEPFSFVALGDTTYAPPADNQLYGQLIDAINAAQPAFSIHVGDTKGYGDCGRTFQESQRDFFNRFAGPVFYTPGNNEWADCWKDNRGAADPTEILTLMRGVFWSKPESLGRVRLPLARESDEIPEFAEFAENTRWTFGERKRAERNSAPSYWPSTPTRSTRSSATMAVRSSPLGFPEQGRRIVAVTRASDSSTSPMVMSVAL